MRSVLVFALAALLMISLSFADVGPAPPQPKVTIELVRNGQPDTSISEVYYICDAIQEPSDSPVGKNTVVLPCSGGACRNDGEWFYKLNPCYGFPGGSLAYDAGDGNLKSAPIPGGVAGGEYYIIFDTEKMTAAQRDVDRIPCIPASVIFAVLCFIVLKK
ncbi:MAG: hypothetical protein V1827_04060 [Candidatus Micrarchaeota archaeon]